MTRKLSELETIKLVQLYREHECLWNMRCDAYKNKQKRTSALQQIAEEMQLEGLTIAEVKAKLKSIRSTYYLEINKIEKSRRSDSGGNVYVPRVKWFHELDAFIKNVAVRRKTMIIDSKSNDKEFKTEIEIIQSPELVSEEIEIIQSPELVSEESRPYSPEYPPARRKKVKLYYDKNTDLSEDEKSQLFQNRLHFNTNFHTEDEFDVVGRNVANKLRSLSKETAILAEKLMMDVLFAAQMGTLNSETTLVLEGHATY